MNLLSAFISGLTLSWMLLSCEQVNAPQLKRIHSRFYIIPVDIDTFKTTVTYKDTNIGDMLLSPLDSMFPLSFNRVDSFYVDSVIRTIHQSDTLSEDDTISAGAPDTTYDTLPGTWVFTSSHKDTLRLPRFDTVKIMPLGNSITEGDYQSNYRRYLWNMLDSAEYIADFIGSASEFYNQDTAQSDYDTNHEGWSGWTTHDLLDSLAPWLQRQTPDIILCHAGTNNSGEPLDSTIISVNKMITVMRKANPKIIILLAQILPIYYDEDWVKNYNKKIDSLARVADSDKSPIILVDHYSGIDNWEHLDDGIHPNRAGYKEMAIKWFQMLISAF